MQYNFNQKIRHITKINEEIGEGFDTEYFEGYRITTERRNIFILIDSAPHCCEKFGCITSEDDTKEFVGAKILSVYMTDKELKTHDLEDKEYDECCAIFVNVDTDRGTLQFVVYNNHDGHYGHDVIIRCEDRPSEYSDIDIDFIFKTSL